jgi:predicted dehydrogenase
MAEQVGIGIIGAGLMGDLHACAFATLPQARVCAVADLDEQRASMVAKKNGIDRVFTDYRRLLDLPDVQAVLIATPEPVHADPAVQAARASKHILLEKPIATTLADADRIVAAAREAGVKLQIGYPLRFDTTHVQIKESINNGSLGEVLSVYSRRNNCISEARRLKGRVTVEQYLAIHDVDLILWYLDDDVVRVSAEIVKGPVYAELGQHDICWIMLKTRRGAVGIVECGWVLPAALGRGGDMNIEVVGSKSVAYATILPTPLALCGPGGWEFPDVLHWTKLHGELVGMYREQARCFLNAIIRGEEPLASGEDGRRSLEVILAVAKAYETGLPVTLPLSAK